MKNLGLFFGTFDPLHNGHVEIASYFISELDLDELRFVVTPHNPVKKYDQISNKEKRLKIVTKFCKNHAKMECSRVEFDLPSPNYTSDTLDHIFNENINSKMFIILGEDNLNNLHNWKDYKKILKHHICVYPRKGHSSIKSKLIDHKMIKLYNAPFKNISSTSIRQKIKKGESIEGLVPHEIHFDVKSLF